MEKKLINGELLTLEQAHGKHHKLIKSVARKYESLGDEFGFELRDLISAGTIGFIEAFKKFDTNSGNRFSTYATMVIIGRIKTEIHTKNGKERIGERIKKRSREFAALGIEDVSVSRIQKELNMHYIYAYEVFHYLVHRNGVHLGGRLRTKGKTSVLYISDTLRSGSDFTRVIVEDFESLLTDKERSVYELLLEGYTQKEIQSILGVKRSTVNMRVVKMREKYNSMLEG